MTVRLLAPAFLLLLTATASAAERDKTQALPGVEEGYRIVEQDKSLLAAEPEPDDASPRNGYGHYRVGDWDVRVSGSVSVEIGTGPARDGR